MPTDLPRWKLRLQSFEKAFNRLEQAVRIEKYTPLELAGLVKIFELTWDLAWKTLKDILEHAGHEITGPRDAIKQGFKNGLLESGDAWLDLLESRNLMAHIYDESKSAEIVQTIRKKYFEMLQTLLRTLKKRS